MVSHTIPVPTVQQIGPNLTSSYFSAGVTLQPALWEEHGVEKHIDCDVGNR